MDRKGAELRVAVVGGGIAGIAAAERLGALGHRAELFEAGARLGGRIAPAALGEREICLGGKNVGRHYRRFRDLVEQRVEPHYEVFGPDTGQLVRGRVRTLSFRSPGMRMRLGARLAARGQVRGGLRFLKLARQVREDPDAAHLGNPFFAELARTTADPALPDYLGTAICRDAVRHITVRMNGAEPGECHVGNFGSNLGLVVDRFDQLGGNALGEWIGAVEAANVVHRRATIAALQVADGAVRGVIGADGARRHFDRVILALPAHQAARLIGESEPQLARLLCTIRYFPVGVIVAEYDRPAFPPQFAAVAPPPGMVLSNAGSYGLGERHIVRYTFSGAPARESIQPETFDPEALLAVAEGFLGAHAPVASARRLGFAARSFQPGLCAYRRDHDVFLVEARERIEELAGLALAGDYMRGASLEACVRSGQEAADRVIAEGGGQTAYPALSREQVPAGPPARQEDEMTSISQPADLDRNGGDPEGPRHFEPGDVGVFDQPWEEVRIGDTFNTRSRTVTEADVVQFAAMTGDWHPAHTDETWATESMFGRRVAHGMLVISYSLGLVPNDAILALRRIKSINFKRPVFLGDTIYVHGKVAGKREMSPEAGMVTGRWRTKNQDHQTICTMELEALWRREGAVVK